MGKFIIYNEKEEAIEISSSYNELKIGMDVRRKLEEYRQRKMKSTKEKPNRLNETSKDEAVEILLPKNNNDSIQEEEIEDVDDSLNCLTFMDIVYYSLCFILWVTLYVIFIKLQFGTIFFIISCLIGIYINTRTSPKKKGEVSAYSVFNKDCKSIDGTLKAEHFEREIRYGPGAMYK